MSQMRGWDKLQRNLRAIEGLVAGGQWAESLLAGGQFLVDKMQERAPVDTGALRDSIRVEIVDNNQVAITVNVSYAAVQEYGLFNQRITARQRRFFWAKHRETKNSMWKALALSSTYSIPAQPYVRPTIDTEATAAAHIIAGAFASKIKEAVT